MKEYDIVVVGGGPAGCSAARAAAEKGAEVLIVEEHPQIGLPIHCQGSWQPHRLATVLGSNREFMEGLVETMDRRVVLSELKAFRTFSPSGRVRESPTQGGGTYLIDRSLFDLELSKQAANAGAEVMLNTKVVDLIREDGTIKGVITNSRTMPKINSKVVIAADGTRSHFKGIPRWEGMAGTDLRVMSGIYWYLTRVKDIEPGIIELHMGSFSPRGWCTLHCHSSVSCTSDIASISEFETIKAGNWVLSKKLRDCRVLRMQGTAHPWAYGGVLPKKVKDGLILTGDAAGCGGNVLAVVSGRFAGEVAAEAVEAGDFTEAKLGKYDELCRKLTEEGWSGAPLLVALRRMNKPDSEEELEEVWEKVAQGEISH